MTSEGLGEMFEGADTCAERRGSRAQTQERGPPSAPAEIFSLSQDIFSTRISGSPKVSLCLIKGRSFARIEFGGGGTGHFKHMYGQTN